MVLTRYTCQEYNKHLTTCQGPPTHSKSLSYHLARLDRFFQRVGVDTPSVKAAAKHLLATVGPGGKVTYHRLTDLGYSRRTAVFVAKRLCGLKVLQKLSDGKGGRGKSATFMVICGFNSDKKTVKTKTIKEKNKKHSKDKRGLSGGVSSLKERGVNRAYHPKVGLSEQRRSTLDYQGLTAARVKLILGARFYRSVMKETRLNLEKWALAEQVRHAVEGFLGNRLDGMALADARELIGRVVLMRAEIEKLARSGASAKRVCAFIAGRLAGRQARRIVLSRTERLEKRIEGLKAWLAERENEYRNGLVCKRCGYVHTGREYRSGYRYDGYSFNCFGFARVQLDELREEVKLARRVEACRLCGGSLRDGHIEGMCWPCHDRKINTNTE